MIRNGKQVNSVFQTKDYGMFKFREDNRVLNQNHIKKLSDKMKNVGWIQGSYAVVNEKGEVIDGQHRIKAAMIANVPVNYTVEKKASFDTIRGLNQNQKNWSMYDHIHGYVTENNPHYIRLNNFMERHPDFRITECLMFLQNNALPVDKHIFETGKWESKNVTKADEWASNIESLKPYFEKGFNKSIFVRAMVKLLSKKPEFKFDEFLHKVKLRPGMIHLCGSVELYIEMIEELYNHHRRAQDKLNLRF